MALISKVEKASVEEEEHEIEIFMEDIKDVPVEENDPFAKPLDESARAYLDAAFKKRLTRLEKRFVGTGGAGSQQIEDEFITAYNQFEVVLPPYNTAYLAKLFEISAAHRGAVDAKVYNIVGLGYDFVDTDKTEERIEQAEGEAKTRKIRRQIERIKRNLRAQLDGFNEDDDFLETLIKVVTDKETTGNGYLEIGRTVNGQIGYIGHVPSQTVRVRRERDGFVQMIGNKAVFFRNFGDRKTPNPLNGAEQPNEMLHFKTYTPTNSYYGVPQIVSAKVAVAGNEFAGKYNLDYFENKAVPRYVVVTKGSQLSKRSQDQLFQFFSTGLKGTHHRTLYLPLPADTDTKKVEFDMKPVEAGVQDASFVNYRKTNLSDILMAHRVPLSKVNTAENTSLAVARDADKTFKEQVTRPEQSILEKKINRVIAELTDVVKLKLNELALSDENTQSQIDERMIRNQIMTPNEIRARKGMPGLPGGDKVVELKPQQAADAKANAGKTRTRDAERSAKRTDSAGEGRSTKGEGRTTKFVKAVGPSFNDGVMIALRVDPELAETLAVEGGVPASEMHITLAYLGKVMDQEVGPGLLARAIDENFAQVPTLIGTISGKGVFVNPEETVTYLSPDIPGLVELRTSLVQVLEAWGVNVFKNHGYTPHISIAYEDIVGSLPVGGQQISFDAITVVWGSTWIDIPINQYEDDLVD